MPANEAIELNATLRSELQLPVCGLAVNMLLPKLFTPEQSAALTALREATPRDPALAPLVDVSATRALREREQAGHLARLKQAIPGPCYGLPQLFTPDLRRAELQALSYELD
jgi:hypothetical protein